MKIIVADTYEGMSQKAFEHLVGLTASLINPLICTTSGDTPKGLYNHIVAAHLNKQLDTSSWFYIGLDEWVGMNGSDEGSCRFHLNNQLYHPLNVPQEKLYFFDGRATNLQAEYDNAEDFIEKHNGIDVAIVGLGTNGHVGMNEPGTPATLRSHIAEIALSTQQTGQKYFKQSRSLTHGITLGIANLLAVENIMLVVSGQSKAVVIKQLVEQDVSEQLPVSLLKHHPNLYLFLDGEAAGMLPDTTT